jgi:hypothetical protein
MWLMKSGHSRSSAEVRFEIRRSGDVVQLPEGDEARIVAVHLVEEMLRPPAVGDGGDLDLHQLEAHHVLVEVTDGGHVPRCESEMMVAHDGLLSGIDHAHHVHRSLGRCGNLGDALFDVVVLETQCPAQRPSWTARSSPMRGHGLMQTIARVNRVFRDKPGGLVVDYLGLTHELKAALAIYSESGGTGRTALDQEEAVAVMLEKYEICCGLFHGFNWSRWPTGTPQGRLGLLPAAQEHVLRQEDGKERCLRAVRELSQGFALAVPHAEALRIRDDVAFFQAVRAVLAKHAPGDARPEEELDHAVRQIISRALAPEGVVDIFAAGTREA